MLSYSFIFLYVFGESLENGVWEDVFGFTRIIVSDTLLYLSISEAQSVPEFLLLSVIKNSIAPSLVWWVFQQNWYLVSVFNAILFFFVLVYTRRLILLLDPAQKSKMYPIAVVLTVVCTYYSVGSLKEIPTLLGFTAVVYHFLAKQKAQALLWFALLVGFRIQFSYLIPAVYLLSRINKNPFRLTLISIAVVGVFFPLLSWLQVFTFDAVEIFRAGSGESSSIGAVVEHARAHIIGVSLLAIMVRVMQSILEPLVLFLSRLSFLEDGDLQLYHLHAFIVLMLLMWSWVMIFFKRFWLISDPAGRYASFGTLYSFLAIAVVAMGGMSIISHRYLIPTYALLLVAAKVNPYRYRRSLLKDETRLVAAGHRTGHELPV